MSSLSTQRIVWALGAALWAAGCTCAPLDVGGRVYACKTDEDCKPGSTCRESRCSPGSAADGGSNPGADGGVDGGLDGGCVNPKAELCTDGLDNDCNGATDCKDSACDGQGCGAGVGVCQGGRCDCPTTPMCGAAAFCDAGLCLPKLPDGASCAGAAECTSGHCVTGQCCATACSAPCALCNGTAGACSPAPGGSPGSPSCGAYVCSGTSTACRTDCTVDAHCSAGSYCSGNVCTPKLAKGQSCTAARECLSNACVDTYCCDGPCSGACDSCSSTPGSCNPLTLGAPGTPTCAPYLCNGVAGGCPTACAASSDCASGNFCNSSGACVPKLANGSTCLAGGNCQSGQCADGYCCATPCTGACDVCNATPGLCTNAAAGSAGSPGCGAYLCGGGPACPATCSGDGACATGFYCSGSACVPKLANGASCTAVNQCLSTFCADNRCCAQPCSGQCDECASTPGTCKVLAPATGGSPSCAPYACNGVNGSCPATCANDSNCAAGSYCNGSSNCVPKVPNGSGCALPNHCLSNFCVDLYCCNSACSSACDVCDSPPGTCTPAAAGSAGSPSCSPYLCSGGPTCPTACANDAGCVTGLSCAGGACRGLIADLLKDDFNDNSLTTPGLWNVSATPAGLGSVVEQGMRLEFHYNANQTGELKLESKLQYDARGSTVRLELLQFQNYPLFWSTLSLSDGTAGQVGFLVTGQTDVIAYVNNNSEVCRFYTGAPLLPGLVRFIRLRADAAGTTVYWERSLDGMSFTPMCSLASPINLANVRAAIRLQVPTSNAGSFTAFACDNLNVP